MLFWCYLNKQYRKITKNACHINTTAITAYDGFGFGLLYNYKSDQAHLDSHINLTKQEPKWNRKYVIFSQMFCCFCSPLARVWDKGSIYYCGRKETRKTILVVCKCVLRILWIAGTDFPSKKGEFLLFRAKTIAEEQKNICRTILMRIYLQVF